MAKKDLEKQEIPAEETVETPEVNEEIPAEEPGGYAFASGNDPARFAGSGRHQKGAAVQLMFYLSKDECKSISDRVSITRICAAQADTFLTHSDLQSNASVYSSCTALLLNKH